MRSWSDTIDPATIPDAVLHSESARRRAAKRKTYGAGTGRPRSTDLCACGEMTRERATARRHTCEPPVSE